MKYSIEEDSYDEEVNILENEVKSALKAPRRNKSTGEVEYQ